ncbi:hypothetical protein BHE74_00050418, partial [Ensete ventricosum]
HNQSPRNRSHYPYYTLAATNRCHLLPSSSIATAAASSSSLPLPSTRPQQHTTSIDATASPTTFLNFCPLFHAALSLGRIIILPKGGLPPTSSVPPLLICCRSAFDSALPLPSLSPVDCRYPSSTCCRSAPAPLPQLPLPSLFLPFLPCRRLLATVAATSPASLALSCAFLPLHLHHCRCQLPDPALPNLFLVAIASHNCCPSPISSYAKSVAIAVSPHCCHLSLVATATCRCLLPCRCCPRCHNRFQPRPFYCTSLLPPL